LSETIEVVVGGRSARAGAAAGAVLDDEISRRADVEAARIASEVVAFE
jgi:hypothetical protein